MASGLSLDRLLPLHKNLFVNRYEIGLRRSSRLPLSPGQPTPGWLGRSVMDRLKHLLDCFAHHYLAREDGNALDLECCQALAHPFCSGLCPPALLLICFIACLLIRSISSLPHGPIYWAEECALETSRAAREVQACS